MRLRKMSTRMLAAFLVIIMALTIVPASAIQVAAETEEEAQLTISIVSAVPGETVELVAVLGNAPAVKSMAISNITYDAAKMTLLNVEWLCDAEIKNWNSAQGRGVLTFGANTDANGPVLKMTFKINDVVEDSDISISCSIILKTMNASGDEVSVATTVIPGKVEIRNEIPGDMDGNEKVNSSDAVYLLYHTLFGKEEYPVKQSGDIDGNGKTDSNDAVYLLYHILFGEEDYPLHGVCSHSLSYFSEQAPTCTEDGNIAYWHCTDCGKYFSDADATTEISLADTVLVATGHTEVVDEAVAPTYDNSGLTEGLHCSVCGEVLQEQQIVSKLEPEYYSITYSNLQGASYPDLNQYASHIGVSDENMPKPERIGYIFEGWFTNSEYADGSKIGDIPEGSTQNYHLYAKWSLISYTITYKDAPTKNNPDTYTVEDEFTLSNPEWTGLTFSHWKDSNGNVCSEIKKGTTGDIELTAYWILKENMAVSSKNNEAITVLYIEELDRYYFIYELGTIENIVLSTLTSESKDKGEILSWNLSESVTVENSIADTVAKTISKSVSQTSEWSTNYAWAESNSSTTSSSITSGLEVEAYGIKAKIEASIGASSTSGTTESKEYGKGGGTTDETGTSNSVSSTVSYSKGINSTFSTTVTIPGEMPAGWYSYVCAGTADVYAIVTYDVRDSAYYLDTFSVLKDATYGARLYTPSAAAANIVSGDALAFKIPTDDIEAYINSAYYVQYDANGGEGEMAISVHSIGEEQKLSSNQYTKPGYSFDGWKLISEGGVEIYSDEAVVSDLAEGGKNIILYAEWVANKYTVSYDANDGTVSPLAQTVTYDLPYGTLPTPYRTGYRFVGWYLDENKIDSTTIVKKAEDHTLTAEWVPNQYTITYDTADGTAIEPRKCTYDLSTQSPADPKRTGYTFAGWKFYNTNTVEEIEFSFGNKMPAYDITAVAQWYKCIENLIVDWPDRTFDASNTYHQDYFYISELSEYLNSNYTLHFKIRVRMKEVAEGYQEIQLANSSGATLGGYGYKEYSYDGGTTEGWTPYICVDVLGENCSEEMHMVYGAAGDNSDDWRRFYIEVSVTVTKD